MDVKDVNHLDEYWVAKLYIVINHNYVKFRGGRWCVRTQLYARTYTIYDRRLCMRVGTK